MEEWQLRMQEILLENNGEVYLNRFKSLYHNKFKSKYQCPSFRSDPCKSFKNCITKHFTNVCSVIDKDSHILIRLGGRSQEVPNVSSDFPKLTGGNAQPLMSKSAADHSKAGANANAIGPMGQASGGAVNPSKAGVNANHIEPKNIGSQSLGTTDPRRSVDTAKPTANGKSVSRKTWTVMPLVPSAFGADFAPIEQEIPRPQPPKPSRTNKRQSYKPTVAMETECDTVRDSFRGPVFEFDLPERHSGDLPTKADVNNRVHAIRGSLSKSGFAVDMTNLTKKLCEYYGVRSVQDLRCTDQRNGFQKEIHISAISEFSRCYCKILCMIHAYCTCSTIATLYDLERFICEKENKETFLDLKIGPLQKIPLVYHHFKFPSDMEIKRLSTTDVMKHLWQYMGKHAKDKKVDMEKFMENLAGKFGIGNPYEMGVTINSIALAIQVVKRTKFGDMAKMKQAENELLQNMEQDLDDYLRKLRRGLTGQNTRALHGQPVNVVQKVAGMHIEDAIMAIFQHANDCKKSIQRNISMQGLFTSTQRIMDTMMFFTSRPVLSKFFHAIVATGTFRALGLDDEQLLVMLGYKDALKKMTEERVMEMYPNLAYQGSNKGDKRTTRHFKEARVKQELRSWLEKCSRPIDLRLLSNVELKVAQSLDLEATGFESIGQGTFLEFLGSHKEFNKLLGSSVVVDSSASKDVDNVAISRKQIEEFTLQCGPGKDKIEIQIAIHKQFPELRHNSSDIDDVISNIKRDVQAQCSLTYLFSLLCGFEQGNDVTSNDASCDRTKTGYLGAFSHEDAMRCLSSAPLLENLAAWSNWSLVFEPQFGDLRSFLLKQEEVHAIEASANVFLKISLDSTPDDLKFALDAHDPDETAGHLLSIIRGHGGLAETPLIHLANIVKSSLAAKLGVLNDIENTAHVESLERFVLQCIIRIPVQFCSAIAKKLFLSPLGEILGDGQGSDAVAARVLAACKTSSERSYLHALGALLAVEEWTTDFRDNQFLRDDPKPKKQTAEVETVKPLHEKDSKICEPKTDASLSGSIKMEEASAEQIVDNDLADTSLEDIDVRTELSSDTEPSSSDFEIENALLVELESRFQHCKDLIDEIRRDEFGKGEELGEKEAILLQRNNDRLCRSLDRLSKELYTKDTHFVLELIQNADDNTYDGQLFSEDSAEKPSVAFIVEQTHVTVLNNECGFQDKDIRAICDVGKSTKGAHRKGYIGQKGIGFKSVFRVTNCPEIHSNGFHICFDASQDSMGYILPEWRDIGDFTDLTEYTPSEVDIPLNWKTQINLPLKNSIMGSSNASARFQDIHPSLLLFLNRLNTIVVDNRVNKKCLVMRKRAQGPNLVELTQNGIPSLWFVVTAEIDMNARGEQETTEVSLAFPLDDPSASSHKTKALPSQSVFAFLPLRSYGFKFLIQADFEVPSSREDIDRDSPWNQSILQEIPRLVVDAFFRFRDGKSTDVMSDPIFATTRLFQFLPLESEILGIFKPIARKILQLLQKEPCIPVITEKEDEEETNSNKNNWMIPSEVILGDSTLRKIISPKELRRYLNLNYMCSVMQDNVNSALLTALGVQVESLDHLMEIGRSHLKVISEDIGKSEATVQWIGKWFLCVSEYLERIYDSSDESRQKIRNASVFPLSNGNMVNMNDIALFFPFATKESKSKEALHRFSQLEEDLNTLDKNLFTGLHRIEQLKVKRLLADLGVKQISPKFVIDKHIIPAFQNGQWKEHLLYSYVIFIKEQYSTEPSMIDMEILKNCVLLHTSNGHVNPSKQQVYFTEKYGNPISLKETFGCVKWTLLDSKYLQSTKPNDVKLWQKFFTKLGVAHFPKMNRITIRLDLEDLANSPWSKLAQTWPTAQDGVYEIEDMRCEEFDEILKSKEPVQLCSLAQELDKRWKSNFSHIQKEAVPVRDSNGSHLTVTFCSTFMRLKTAKWLPGSTGSTQSQASSTISLFAPKDLYLRQQSIVAVLAEFCPYFCGTLDEPSFIEAIGIQNRVNIEEVFQQIEKWAGSSDFMTSLNHMTNVYHFIKSQSSKVDRPEFDKPIIFVPSATSSQGQGDEKVRGRFCKKTEVCLYDHSTISIRFSSLFPNRRHLLFQFYPKDILDFFENDLKIDNTPNVREYVDMACILADSIRLPDATGVNNLMVVLSTLGEKCLVKSESEIDISIHSETDIGSIFVDFKQRLDKTKSIFVFSHVKEERILPTTKDKFVSLKEAPLLADNEQELEIFRECDDLYFLQLPQCFRDWIKGERFTRDGGKQMKIIRGILAFFAICNINLLSAVICPLEIIPEHSERGCFKWQKELARLLPFIQRYLLFKEKKLYDSLVEDNIVTRMENVKFFTAKTLTAVHRVKGNDKVVVTKRRKVALEAVESSTYIYIGRDFLDEKEDVISEFLKIFIEHNQELEEKLSDLLLLLSSDSNVKENEKHLRKKGIGLLPKDEEPWKISDPTPRPVIQKQQSVDPKINDQPEPTGGITCWPPPMPGHGAGGDRPQSTYAKQQMEQLKQWPVPPPPESMTQQVQPGPIRSDVPRAIPQPPAVQATEGGSYEESKHLIKRQPSRPEATEQVDKASHTPHARTADTMMRINGTPPINNGIIADVAKVNREAPAAIGDNAGKKQSAVSQERSQNTAEEAYRNKPAAVHQRSQLGKTPITAQQIIHQLSGQTVFCNGLQEPAITLQCAYENIEIGEIDETVHTVNLDINAESADSEQVGRIGEMIVYNELKKQMASNGTKVIWLNEQTERFAPCDIVIERTSPEQETEYRFVEVKATKVIEDKPFEISSQELKFAFANEENYDVYRVCGITGKLDNVNIKRLAGLAKFMDRKAVNVFIVL